MPNLFPAAANALPAKILGGLLLVAATTALGVWYYFPRDYSLVGYAPKQPVAFNHHLHVTQLGMDCRYCHTFVDRSGHSNVPDASTCYNCHGPDKGNVLGQDPRLAPIRQSYTSGEPVPWVRIHRVPDYVYFNHAVHVNRGVSCVSCHGQVNEMEVAYHAEPLSMAFCLDCHRNPEQNVRPLDEVYNLAWQPESKQAQAEQGTQFVHDWNINPPQSCSGCHR